jgi:hypothetical protein
MRTESLRASFRTPHYWTPRLTSLTVIAAIFVVSIWSSAPVVLSVWWAVLLVGIAVATFRAPYHVDLTDHALVFRALAGTRVLALEDIKAVELGWTQSLWRNVTSLRRSECRFCPRSGRRVRISTGKGIHDFLDEVAIARPDLRAELAPRWNHAEQSRGRSGYRRLA